MFSHIYKNFYLQERNASEKAALVYYLNSSFTDAPKPAVHKEICSVNAFIYLRGWKCPSQLCWVLQVFNKIKYRTLPLYSSSRQHA